MESSGFTVDIVDVRLEQANRDDWSAQAGPEWRDAEALYAHLANNTNHVRAAERVSWNDLIPEGATVLDLGCGSGWLTGMLTRNKRVATVIAWDLSPSLLTEVLPATVTLTEAIFRRSDRCAATSCLSCSTTIRSTSS